MSDAYLRQCLGVGKLVAFRMGLHAVFKLQ